ncbi:hypothetical protein F3K34_43760 [Streptomyces sp. LBUM 1486]|uniref:hypothetical protein n=1 Tax=Streptomyces scabiei TaxID=1930 RepID=UPI001B327A69|nr:MULTISPECIES: hypothetical protein [Streptomyces]MBP5918704.1 hypothetical protein [Streptomyces sp. LBUM 1486]MDX2800170.1 hypothetical protein [Streptomyces scabiei]MDX3125839.1 hypothetical protein [Streptomyces scabiei]
MTAQGEDPYGDVLAAAPSVLAETALRQVEKLLTDGASSKDISDVATTAVALLDMHQRARVDRSRKRRWLAKVTSFAFPRTFSTGPLPKTDDLSVLLSAGRRHHHVCVTVQITEGGKHAVGREVEVQIPADQAIKLGRQMVRVATALLPAPSEGEQTSPSKGDRVT